MATTEPAWDFVVIGSGAAGLCAALTARDKGLSVCVLERTGKVGGTTALSAGAAWIPVNHHMASVGINDTVAEALTYFRALAGGADDPQFEIFVRNASRMLRYIENRAGLQYEAVNSPDFRQDLPGSKPRGRTLYPLLYHAKMQLGDWTANLRQPWGMAWLRNGPLTGPILLSNSETQKYGVSRNPANIPQELVARRRAEGWVSRGAAVIAGLAKACLDAGVAFRLNSRVRELVRSGGRVTGVVAETPDGAVTIAALKGVLLACGGFEWSEELKRRFIPGALTHPNSPAFNDGDGIRLAMAVDAELSNTDDAWWQPAVHIPGETYEGAPLNRFCVEERNWPHSLMVNRSGRRFINECANYYDMGLAFNAIDPATKTFANIPAWIVFDADYRATYPCVVVRPSDPDPNWLTKADSLAALAAKTGIHSDAFQRTVAEFNTHAANGHDPEFHRGKSALDIAYGDPQHRPNAVLGPVAKPPFYALAVHPGAVGTRGGPRVNARSQVMEKAGSPIAGLYAAGVIAGRPRCGYAGSGHSIAEALTWGMIAAESVAAGW